MGLFDSHPYRRDTHGPMDLDGDESEKKLEGFMSMAVDDPDEPSRKRLHSEAAASARIFSTPTRSFRVTPSTPFLFNSSSIPAAPASTSKYHYDPAKFAQNGFKLGTATSFGGSSASRFGEIQEVDMDSPSRNPASSSGSHAPSVPTPSRHEMGTSSLSQEVQQGTDEHDPAQAGHASPEVEVEERPIAKGGYQREMRKRRNKAAKQARVETEDEETEVDTPKRYRKPRREVTRDPHALRHSEIPALLSGYIQVIVNASFVLGVLIMFAWLAYNFYADVKDKQRQAVSELLDDISECTRFYTTNRCDPGVRVPAMEAACQGWEMCMKQDPTSIRRTQLFASTFGESVSGFFEAISFKAMSFFSLFVIFMMWGANFGPLRARTREDPAYYPPPHPSQMALGYHPQQYNGQYGAGMIGLPGYQGYGAMPGQAAQAGHASQAGQHREGEGQMRQLEYPRPETSKSRWKLW